MVYPRTDFAISAGNAATLRPLVMGRRAMVSAGHYAAARAGEHILSAGGNAIDAGVAAGIALNVLLYDRTSFGGVAPIILYHAATRQVVTLDGLGAWPALADREYLWNTYGGRMPEGILRSVTPAAPDAWLTALERFGRMTLAEVLEPAIELAEGAPASTCVVQTQRGMVHELDLLDRYAVDLFFPGGRAPEAGTVMSQPDLANVFRTLSDAEAAARRQGASRQAAIRQARDLFYQGPIAERIDAFHRSHGGWMRYADLASHQVEVSPSLHASYRGYDVYACGPWCQGPLLLQWLKILEHFDLDAMEHNSVAYLHLLAGVMDLGFADREQFYGDPRQVEVPVAGLLSDGYARSQAGRLQAEAAFGRMPAPGNPWRYQPGGEGRSVLPVDVTRYAVTGNRPVQRDTSYVAAGDAEGNLFSATPSDPVFASPVVPGLGFSCSGRGSQSRLEAGHPSAVAPGKRPRLTPNPALVMQGGRPLMAFGCPGADGQTQGMLQFLLNLVHWGMNPQQAAEAPRAMSYNYPQSFSPHDYYPGRLDVEARVPAAVREGLRSLGYDLRVAGEWASPMSTLHAVLINPSTGVLLGAADPRRPGAATGW